MSASTQDSSDAAMNESALQIIPENTPALPADPLTILHGWAENGWLRRLDSALAAFMRELDSSATPALLVSTAVLAQMEGRGHTCLPLRRLVAQPDEILAWPQAAHKELTVLWLTLPGNLSDWLSALRTSPLVRSITLNPSSSHEETDRGQPLVLGGTTDEPLLYLRRYWLHERQVSCDVLQRTTAVHPVDEAPVRRWLDRLFDPSGNEVDWQKLACAVALRASLTVITGGPGTGKTYTAARLLALLFATHAEPERLRVALAAPTGKAAARLRQSIDVSLQELSRRLGNELDLETFARRMGAARTLHSLLGARPDTRQFRFNARHLLDIDILIVDEASMIHLEMMAALLQAMPAGARIILLGDKDQLASVEAGAVLGDLCRDALHGHYDPETARYAKAVAGITLPREFLAGDANGHGTDATPDEANDSRRDIVQQGNNSQIRHAHFPHPNPLPEGEGTNESLREFHVKSTPLAQQTVMLRKSRRFGGLIGQLAWAVNNGNAELARQLIARDTTGVLQTTSHPTAGTAPYLAVHGRPGAPACYADYLRLVRSPPRDAMTHADHHESWVKSVLLAFERFRILCAVHGGDWGTESLNAAVQQALAAAGLLKPAGEWFAGRPVMVTRNDPELGVFNGDVGVALPGTRAYSALRVYFLDGDRLRSVGVSRLAHVETAFAMTVHKSQGSEFLHTALVLPLGGAKVLTRELVYTGITRARENFTLIEGQAGLLHQAIEQQSQRASGLGLQLG
jgi:exodeoxyribonuclease V alpha subunit